VNTKRTPVYFDFSSKRMGTDRIEYHIQKARSNWYIPMLPMISNAATNAVDDVPCSSPMLYSNACDCISMPYQMKDSLLNYSNANDDERQFVELKQCQMKNNLLNWAIRPRSDFFIIRVYLQFKAFGKCIWKRRIWTSTVPNYLNMLLKAQCIV